MVAFSALDIGILVGYFILVILTGIFAMWRHKRGTTSDYFLGGRMMTFIPIGLSLFASNIGSEHFIGLAGSGAATGLGVASFEFNSLILVNVLGFVFLPVYIASGVYTMPQYLYKRFGGKRIYLCLTVLSIAMYILTKISVNLYSGALFIREAIGWSLYPSIAFILTISAIISATGGLAAVIYTDSMQAALMVSGGLSLMVIAFNRVGGLSGLYKQYPIAIQANLTNQSMEFFDECAKPTPRAFQMLRPIDDPDMPWLGFLLGQSFASVWYWCADQVIVQRALAAKNINHAQGGTLVAGYLKILPLYMMVMVGMISRVLYPNEIGCVDADVCERVCGNAFGCTNLAFPKIVMELLPTGLRGLLTAVMLAALVSDLTSIFNSASSLFTMDIYHYFRKKASNIELMIVGRAFVVCLTIISIVWIPVIQSTEGAQLYIYIQSICAAFVPPISVMFILAIAWPRYNETAAFWSLLGSFCTGVARCVFEFAFAAPRCASGEPDVRPFFARMHYMYFALLVSIQMLISGVAIALLTKPDENWRRIRTTFGERFNESDRPDEFVVESVEMEALDSKEPMYFDDVDEAGRETRTVSYWRRCMYLVCGFELDVGAAPETAANEKSSGKVELIRQSDTMRRILWANFALIAVITIALYTYYSI